MEEILGKLTSSFDLLLMVSITVLSYIVLKSLELLLILKTSKVLKKIITLILSAILCVIYYKYVNLTLEQIIPTYLISVAFYDNIIKFIINKMNIGYDKTK